jgi:hypothetical protein
MFNALTRFSFFHNMSMNIFPILQSGVLKIYSFVNLIVSLPRILILIYVISISLLINSLYPTPHL